MPAATKFFVIFFVFALSVLSVRCQSRSRQTFNVIKFGAKDDGHNNGSQAFEDAWKATCSSKAASPMMVVPDGYKFLLLPIAFSGPCKSNKVNVVIDGTLVAPNDPSEWKCDGNCSQWISFLHLYGLYISGSGTINGQGEKWWDCEHYKMAVQLRNRGLQEKRQQ